MLLIGSMFFRRVLYRTYTGSLYEVTISGHVINLVAIFCTFENYWPWSLYQIKPGGLRSSHGKQPIFYFYISVITLPLTFVYAGSSSNYTWRDTEIPYYKSW